jgi:septal ring factor EnvC (AmiA/AmiB activator)
METIITYILIAGCSFWVGYKIASLISAAAFRDILRDLGVSDEKIANLSRKYDTSDTEDEKVTPQLTEIEVKIEQCQGQLYAFRADNDQFLGQGVDRESLIKRLAESMVDVRLIIREENGAALIKQES